MPAENVKRSFFHISIRFVFPGREVIVMWVIFDIHIVDDYVYKSTSADSWYRSLEVSNAPKTELSKWRR